MASSSSALGVNIRPSSSPTETRRQLSTHTAPKSPQPSYLPIPQVTAEYPADEGDAAWILYLQKAREFDDKLVRDWNGKLSGIIIFSALFAAVATTLLLETLSLLRPDPQDNIQNLLFFMATQTVNRSETLPPDLSYRADETAPHWAFIVNALLVSSITFSVLVALGSILCLEWVNEYDSRGEAGSTLETQALRRHYRWRGVQKWQMARLISALPFLMFMVVALFFAGLVVWLWNIDYQLAILPLLGITITSGGYLATTILTVLYPSAPFKTTVVKTSFQAWAYTKIFAWFTLTASTTWVQSVREGVLRRNKPRRLSSLFKTMGWAKAMEEWRGNVRRRYPWLPRGLHLKTAMTLGRREAGMIQSDNTLRFSALAWLASVIDQGLGSSDNVALILKKIDTLDDKELHGWGELEYEAPWAAIFESALFNPSKDQNFQDDREELLAKILKKMAVNRRLFSRMVRSIHKRSLVLKTVQQIRKTLAHDLKEEGSRRLAESLLRGMNALLGILRVNGLLDANLVTEGPAPVENMRKSTLSDPLVREILEVIEMCLESSHQTTLPNRDSPEDDPASDGPQHRISEEKVIWLTSWIFPLCHHYAECSSHGVHSGRACDVGECIWHDSVWPDPDFAHDSEAFLDRTCRLDAIVHFIRLVDDWVQETYPLDLNPEDNPISRLLIDHILLIHLVLDRDEPQPASWPGFIFKTPALNVLFCTITGNSEPYAYKGSFTQSSLSGRAVNFWCHWIHGVKIDVRPSDHGVLCYTWSGGDDTTYANVTEVIRPRMVRSPSQMLRSFLDFSHAKPLESWSAVFRRNLYSIVSPKRLNDILKTFDGSLGAILDEANQSVGTRVRQEIATTSYSLFHFLYEAFGQNAGNSQTDQDARTLRRVSRPEGLLLGLLHLINAKVSDDILEDLETSLHTVYMAIQLRTDYAFSNEELDALQTFHRAISERHEQRLSAEQLGVIAGLLASSRPKASGKTKKPLAIFHKVAQLREARNMLRPRSVSASVESLEGTPQIDHIRPSHIEEARPSQF